LIGTYYVTIGLRELTQQWGPYEEVTLYLNRCQVDTPDRVVRMVWNLVAARRPVVGKVIDFGAGDGRFARYGSYKRYVGYEIDSQRVALPWLSPGASIVHRCAFSARVADADVCIGNPPYVRNQDLPAGWRERAEKVIRSKTGVEISGLANAWQYFTLLALASTAADGLVALVIPYEWVSRPSAKALRDYIRRKGWSVETYRLRDETFHRLLTTSSIALIDKRPSLARWKYFQENCDGTFEELGSATGSSAGLLRYSRGNATEGPFARRGLSPGTQKVLTLTEGERVHHGLRIEADVVRCITSMRNLEPKCSALSLNAFEKHYMRSGAKCWLPRTDREPSERLAAYFKGIAKTQRRTSTCDARDIWWKFTMPESPSVLVASGFRGNSPKAVRNNIRAIAVGSVSGVYGLTQRKSAKLVRIIHSSDLRGEIVTHSNGLRKLEIGQLETFLARVLVSNSSLAE
jgi:hypothetical protein